MENGLIHLLYILCCPLRFIDKHTGWFSRKDWRRDEK